MEVLQSFSYDHLNLDENEVRFVQISRIEGSRDISCSIVKGDLNGSVRHKALSYTWGPATPTQDIILDGKRFAVTLNLYHFLAQLTTRSGFAAEDGSSLNEANVGLLWIDQICIDQSNEKERNHQVARMARIYTTATSVIVWLGSWSDAQRTIFQEKELVSDFLAGQQQEMAALRYWSRVWIVQEIVLANGLVFCWGDVKFGSTGDTFNFSKYFGSTSHHISNIIRLRWLRECVAVPVSWTGSNHGRITGPTWDDILELDLHCKDARDQVYGFLGIMHPDLVIEPDYGKTVEQVLQDVMAVELWCNRTMGRESLISTGHENQWRDKLGLPREAEAEAVQLETKISY